MPNRLDRSSRIAAMAFAAALAVPALARAEAPAPTAITPALIEAAKKEGKVVFYTAMDLQVAERVGKAFETAFPGVSAQIERSGAERNFQRLAQERGSDIHAVDVIESSDMTHLTFWKHEGWLEAFVPADVTRWPATERDKDGFFAAARLTLSPMGYNTKLVKAADAPKSFADLLDEKWKGKIVKSHPGYSGTTMTATFEMARDMGWDYFQKLGKQRVMQVQSGTEPPKKLALGERPVMADGGEYVILELKAKGSPVEIVYPTEGTPAISGGAGIVKDAPHPNAARLFTEFLFSRDGQQILTDVAFLRSFHPDVMLKAGMKPLSEIKLMQPDPEAQAKETDTIKQKYAEYFGL